MRAGQLRLKTGLFRLTMVWAILSVLGAVVYTAHRCKVDSNRFWKAVGDFTFVWVPAEMEAGERRWRGGPEKSDANEPHAAYDFQVKMVEAFTTSYMTAAINHTLGSMGNEQTEWFLEHFSPSYDKALAVVRADTIFARAADPPKRLVTLLALSALVGGIAGVASLWSAIVLIWMAYRVSHWVTRGFVYSGPGVEGKIERLGDESNPDRKAPA